MIEKKLYIITSNSMSPYLNIGDIIFVEKKNSSSTKVGYPSHLRSRLLL